MSDLEKAIVGSCIIYGAESAQAAWKAGLNPEHFTEGVYQSFWAMVLAELKSNHFDMAKVTNQFIHKINFATLTEQAVMPSSVEAFAEALIDKARDIKLDRAVIEFHNFLKNKKDFDGTKATNEAFERLIKLFYQSDSKPKKFTARDIYLKMAESWERQEKEGYCNEVVPTGFKPLDEVLNGGIRRGGMFTLAAKTGVGKSIQALNFALKAGLAGAKVLYVTVEIDELESYSRIIAAYSSGDYAKILSGPRSKSEFKAYDDAWAELLKHNIEVLVYDEAAYIEDVEQVVRFEKLGKPYDLVIIDYIGQFKVREKYLNRVEMISAVSSFAKLRLAKKHNIAVICVAQMNRNTEAEGHSGLRLGNIADAAAIERDSDVVALLFREDSKNPTEEALMSGFDVENLAWLKIKKHRHGKNNISIPLKFNGYSARFDEFNADDLKQAQWNRSNYVAPSQPRKKIKMTEGEKIAANRRYKNDDEV